MPALVCLFLHTLSFVHTATTGGGRHVCVPHMRCCFAYAHACFVLLCLHALLFIHVGVVASMHAHVLFACAHARSCSSMPVHTAVPLCSFVLVSIHLLVPICPWLFVSAQLCLSPLSGCPCLAFACAWVLVGVRLGLFVLVQPLFMLIWACLCFDWVGSERKRVD